MVDLYGEDGCWGGSSGALVPGEVVEVVYESLDHVLVFWEGDLGGVLGRLLELSAEKFAEVGRLRVQDGFVDFEFEITGFDCEVREESGLQKSVEVSLVGLGADRGDLLFCASLESVAWVVDHGVGSV